MPGRSARLDGRLMRLLVRMRDHDDSRWWSITRDQAIRALGRSGLEAAIRTGDLARVLPNTYVAGDRRREHRALCAAVTVWSHGALWISGESALHLYKRTLTPPPRVHAIAPREWHGRTPGWLAVRRVEMPRGWSSPEGIRCVFSEMALLDAWARAMHLRREDLVYEALWCRAVGPVRLTRAASSLARLPERRRFDRLMADFRSGATSPTEVLARREVFTGPEFAELEWQVEMRVAGRDRTADGLHRRARVLLELDGEAYHSGSAAVVARDRDRDTDFSSEGWHPVHYSFRDLRDRPDRCRATLAGIIAHRLRLRDGA